MRPQISEGGASLAFGNHGIDTITFSMCVYWLPSQVKSVYQFDRVTSL